LEKYFSGIHLSKNDCSDTSESSIDQCKVQLRYWVLKGKLSQCSEDIEDAYSWYVKCKSLLESSEDLLQHTISMNLKSMYDPIIDSSNIQAKLSLLQVGKLFVTAKQKLQSEDYTGVIEDLEPVVVPKLNSVDLIESTEIIQMINLLAKAYMENNKNLEAWNCYMRMFCCLMRQLMVYGADHTGLKQPYLNKNEDVEFFKLLGLVNNVMDQLVSLAQSDKSEGKYKQKKVSYLQSNLLYRLDPS
jgi:hypothetical protein